MEVASSRIAKILEDIIMTNIKQSKHFGLSFLVFFPLKNDKCSSNHTVSTYLNSTVHK